MVATASMEAVLAWIMIFIVFFTRAFWGCKNRCLLHKDGILWHDCVFMNKGCLERRPQWSDLATAGTASRVFVWANVAIKVNSSSLESNILPTALVSLAGLKYLFTCFLIMPPSRNLMLWSRITYSMVSYITMRIPFLSSNGGCSDYLLIGFFSLCTGILLSCYRLATWLHQRSPLAALLHRSHRPLLELDQCLPSVTQRSEVSISHHHNLQHSGRFPNACLFAANLISSWARHWDWCLPRLRVLQDAFQVGVWILVSGHSYFHRKTSFIDIV